MRVLADHGGLTPFSIIRFKRLKESGSVDVSGLDNGAVDLLHASTV
jgi:hypothetical protein